MISGVYMKEIELKISQFIDGELPLEEQRELFKVLSLDSEARETFNGFLAMKNSVKLHYSSMETDLSGIKLPLGNAPKSRNIYKPISYFSAAAILIIFIFSGLLFSNFVALQSKFNAVNTEYKSLKETSDYLKKINDFFKTTLVQESKPVIKVIRSGKFGKTITRTEQTIAENKFTGVKSKMDDLYNNFTSIKITKNDFILPQMIGN